MKKILGILGVTVIAATMFFNTNSINSTVGNLDLAGLVGVNSANAECSAPPSCSSVCRYSPIYHCILTCENNSITCPDTFPL